MTKISLALMSPTSLEIVNKVGLIAKKVKKEISKKVALISTDLINLLFCNDLELPPQLNDLSL